MIIIAIFHSQISSLSRSDVDINLALLIGSALGGGLFATFLESLINLHWFLLHKRFLLQLVLLMLVFLREVFPLCLGPLRFLPLGGLIDAGLEV
jgi:hypothetical protein